MGIVTILANFGILRPYSLFLDFPAIFKQFELYRLLGSLFFLGRLSFHFCIQLYFLYQYSSQLESDGFAGRTADYLYMVIITSISLWVFAYFIGFSIVSHGLIMSIIYIWSRYYPNIEVTFYFGIRFRGIYLPWVLMTFDILVSGSLPFLDFTGVIAGHIYYYLTVIYPIAQNRPNYLETPQFLQRMLPASLKNVPNMGREATERAQERNTTRAQQGTGYNWGAGRALG
eukprot:gene2798-3479_t